MDQIGHDQHPDLAAETTQRAGQAVAVLATLSEAAARLAAEQLRRREQREQQAHEDQERRTRAADKLREQDQLARYAAARQRTAHDRRIVAQTLDGDWVATADLYDLATAWRTARIHEQDFPEARAAAETVEDRLRHLYPDAMDRYDDALSHGVPRAAAMGMAAAAMFSPPTARPYGPGTRAGALTAADQPANLDPDFVDAIADEQLHLATGTDPDDYATELARLGTAGDAFTEALREALAERAGRDLAHAAADAATSDNPATPDVDEHTTEGQPHSTTDTADANRDNAAAGRTAAQLAGEWFPDGLNHPHAMPPDVANRQTATTTRTAGRTAGLSR